MILETEQIPRCCALSMRSSKGLHCPSSSLDLLHSSSAQLSLRPFLSSVLVFCSLGRYFADLGSSQFVQLFSCIRLLMK
ncbi:hypothetical protein Ancab_018477 [Ancistrocladus abbreviatus]